ncbi:hypothetical protein L0B53_01115 [Vibrio sp. SS-MA-C1-2]|uniref:hypothetical protein n=1 Tax=Vibrio sp. SS-MA-C1-2 TaxID=2908646 RepID=UPI001F39318A|nr:hypothetical protein [Vibrio sp. SS-MA-C1-2]UJF17408.1 hypothetical protein L0B53_01115 [Vibrio sp. SS-MA-C1-2]
MSRLMSEIKKELLQHPIITRLPLGVALVVAIVIFSFQMPDNMTIEYSGMLPLAQQSDGFAGFVGSFVHYSCGMLVFFLALSYLASTLLKERQEGTASFWRSMPVSDYYAIGIKLLVSLVVIPLVSLLLLLFFDLLILLLGQWFPVGANLSLASLVIHLLHYLLTLVCFTVVFLPLASLLLLVSQLTKHPLISLFIGYWVSSLLFKIILGTSNGISYFISLWFKLPTAIFSQQNPFMLLTQHGVSLVIMLVISVLLLLLTSKLRSAK